MSDQRPRPSKEADEIRDIYADMAPRFDRFEPFDRLVTGRYRNRLFSHASGRVVDVACGTGVNFPYLPEDVHLVGIDLSEAMLARASERLAELDLDGEVRQADAADLPFGDDSFDTVISSLSTCTFPEPVAVLREMDRVCAPDGRILLLEHGRSSVGALARFQDWWAPRHFEKHACRWNQEPADLVSEAGLEALAVDRSLLGVITSMVVRPTGGDGPGVE